MLFLKGSFPVKHLRDTVTLNVGTKALLLLNYLKSAQCGTHTHPTHSHTGLYRRVYILLDYHHLQGCVAMVTDIQACVPCSYTRSVELPRYVIVIHVIGRVYYLSYVCGGGTLHC